MSDGTYSGEGDQVDVVISELCSADHRRRSRSLTAALRPSADVAALLRTRTPVGASSFGGVCHQLEVMRLSRVSDKRRFLVLHGVLCELMALQ